MIYLSLGFVFGVLHSYVLKNQLVFFLVVCILQRNVVIVSPSVSPFLPSLLLTEVGSVKL